MKLKRIAIKDEFRWNKILFDAICNQFNMLGYKWYAENDVGGLSFCNFNHGSIYVASEGCLLQESNGVRSSSCEILSLEEFFKLTPEDVRVEQERFGCRFLWDIKNQVARFSTDSVCTQDQIDKIIAIMNEGES